MARRCVIGSTGSGSVCFCFCCYSRRCSMADDGKNPYRWKYPAEHPNEKPKVNGDHVPPDPSNRPRPRRIVIDTSEWGNGATD